VATRSSAGFGPPRARGTAWSSAGAGCIWFVTTLSKCGHVAGHVDRSGGCRDCRSHGRACHAPRWLPGHGVRARTRASCHGWGVCPLVQRARDAGSDRFARSPARAPSTQVVERGEFRNARGELLATLPIGRLARKHGAETVVVSRADLISLLAEHAGPVRYDHDVCGFTSTRGGVIAQLRDGHEERFALLVGADGLHSAIRDALGTGEPIRHAEQDIWVGTASWWSPQLTPGVIVATVGTGRASGLRCSAMVVCSGMRPCRPASRSAS
jgi:hypothetical protein